MVFPRDNPYTKVPANQQEGHKIKKTECPQGIIDEPSKVNFYCFKPFFNGANGKRSKNNVFSNNKKSLRAPNYVEMLIP